MGLVVRGGIRESAVEAGPILGLLDVNILLLVEANGLTRRNTRTMLVITSMTSGALRPLCCCCRGVLGVNKEVCIILKSDLCSINKMRRFGRLCQEGFSEFKF